jgi:hypothetical protein
MIFQALALYVGLIVKGESRFPHSFISLAYSCYPPLISTIRINHLDGKEMEAMKFIQAQITPFGETTVCRL